MQSKATTVAQYLASLPEDRRADISMVREVILKNLDKDIVEGMQYGMIGYAVPHSVFPHGYHCDPKQPLPFAGLASQKNHMALYIMCFYGDAAAYKRFQDDWKKAGKKLDAGKSCIRFKKLDDLSLDVVGATIKRITAKKFIDGYTAALAAMGKGLDGKKLPSSGAGTVKKGSKKTAARPAGKARAAKTARKKTGSRT